MFEGLAKIYVYSFGICISMCGFHQGHSQLTVNFFEVSYEIECTKLFENELKHQLSPSIC
jgi:hypothetical protein